MKVSSHYKIFLFELQRIIEIVVPKIVQYFSLFFIGLFYKTVKLKKILKNSLPKALSTFNLLPEISLDVNDPSTPEIVYTDIKIKNITYYCEINTLFTPTRN